MNDGVLRNLSVMNGHFPFSVKLSPEPQDLDKMIKDKAWSRQPVVSFIRCLAVYVVKHGTRDAPHNRW